MRLARRARPASHLSVIQEMVNGLSCRVSGGHLTPRSIWKHGFADLGLAASCMHATWIRLVGLEHDARKPENLLRCRPGVDRPVHDWACWAVRCDDVSYGAQVPLGSQSCACWLRWALRRCPNRVVKLNAKTLSTVAAVCASMNFCYKHVRVRRLVPYAGPEQGTNLVPFT